MEGAVRGRSLYQRTAAGPGGPRDDAMFAIPTTTKRPSEADDLDDEQCRACHSREDLQVVAFPDITCNCDALPFEHPWTEYVCRTCRRELTKARARNHLWRHSN